jgi:hypothetical protein
VGERDKKIQGEKCRKSVSEWERDIYKIDRGRDK